MSEALLDIHGEYLLVYALFFPRALIVQGYLGFTCLQRWVKAQAPKIPSTFLKAFPDE